MNASQPHVTRSELQPLLPVAFPRLQAAPGTQLRYTWTVPEESGPQSNDCVPYTYTNGVNEIGACANARACR